MQLGIPDRVPVMCQLSIGHYFLHSGVMPLDIWFTTEGFAQALVNLQQRYQFDGILVNLHGRAPDWEKHVDRIVERPGETFVWWKNGCYSKVPHNDNPHYYQADGTRYFPTFEELDPEKLFYIDPWDLTDISWPYTWGLEGKEYNHDFPPWCCDTLKRVKTLTGETVSVHGEVFSPFSQLLELLNYEAALMGLIDDPEKAHACLNALTQGAVALGIKEVEAGADAIVISSAFAGSGFISPRYYEEFVVPYEKAVISGIKERFDIPVYTHTCGGIGDRLDMMMASGTNGIDTLDPPPLGTVELEEAVEKTKGKVFLKGNLDPVNELLNGTPHDLEKAIIKRLNLAMPGGGFILSTACSVAPATPPERIKKLSEIVLEKGKY